MISRLRWKLVGILMCVVTVILLAVLVSMLVSTAANSRSVSLVMLEQALTMPGPGQAVYRLHDVPIQEPVGFSSRTPVLLAELSEDGGTVIGGNLYQFIDQKDAAEVFEIARNQNGRTGIIKNYKLRWMKTQDGKRIAFIDISREQQLLKNIVITALPIGGIAIGVFFVISLGLSRWAVGPVKRAWERQRRFIADASHELKTPLTVILSNSEMLIDAPEPHTEKKQRRLEHINAEAIRMKKLVEDMLTLENIDAGKNSVPRDLVCFSDVVTNTVLIFEPIIYDACKVLKYEIPENIMVRGDGPRLNRLVSILLDNACKYTPQKGEIVVKLQETSDKTVCLTVRSDGASIPSDELQNIFMRFYRVDKSRISNGGFGLGLSIAEGIVNGHGGRIWAESKNGNTFFVTLRSPDL